MIKIIDLILPTKPLLSLTQCNKAEFSPLRFYKTMNTHINCRYWLHKVTIIKQSLDCINNRYLLDRKKKLKYCLIVGKALDRAFDIAVDHIFLRDEYGGRFHDNLLKQHCNTAVHIKQYRNPSNSSLTKSRQQSIVQDCISGATSAQKFDEKRTLCNESDTSPI